MTLTLRNGIYHWKKMVNGHLFARTTKTGDKKLAETLATLWEAEAIKEVQISGNKPMSLHDVLDAFLKQREGTAGYNGAKNALRFFYTLPNVRMNEISEGQVQALVDKRRKEGVAHNTLVVFVNYWNAVCKMCEDKKWITGPKLPRMHQVQTRLRYLTAEEEARIFDAIDPEAKFPGKNGRNTKARQDNSDFMLFLLHVGCRYSEASKMKWNQIDLQNRTILVLRNKRGINNTLVMSDQLHAMLSRRQQTAKDEYVFSGKKSHNNNGFWIKAALERAGITEGAGKISMHTMRHTYASRMLKSGMSLVEVQALLGHRKISSTMVYSHIETGAVAEKAARVLSATAA